MVHSESGYNFNRSGIRNAYLDIRVNKQPESMQDKLQNSAGSSQQKDNIENYEQYLLHGRGAIIQKLRQLGKSKNMITAHFGGGQYSMLTVVIDVLPDRDLLVLDYGANETINKKLLDTNRVVFKTQHDGITAQFTATRLQRCKLHGKTAFACPIPEDLLWVQRREFYRVRIPLGENVTCTLVNGENESVTYKVLDISISGLCLHNTSNKIQFEVEQTFSNCKLNLANHGTEAVNLIVRNVIPIKQDDPSAGERVGCCFANLASDLSANIQRYIHTIDALTRRVDD